jgi:hypothetical protein
LFDVDVPVVAAAPVAPDVDVVLNTALKIFIFKSCNGDSVQVAPFCDLKSDPSAGVFNNFPRRSRGY